MREIRIVKQIADLCTGTASVLTSKNLLLQNPSAIIFGTAAGREE
jgi:hypothetical protein